MPSFLVQSRPPRNFRNRAREEEELRAAEIASV